MTGLVTAQQKDAIIEARGQSKLVAATAGTRKYTITLNDGRKFICIDLMNEDPGEVERQLRVQFAHYGVEKIEL